VWEVAGVEEGVYFVVGEEVFLGVLGITYGHGAEEGTV
jgi:hypothetical protein